MDSLTPRQAQTLFDTGGFLLLTALPEGSEFGIDGTYHITRRFSGSKFLPPGTHLVTWSPPLMSSAGPSAIPIRSGLLRVFQSRERVSLRYDPALEDVPLTSTTEDEIISDEHLRAIDRELAPYPFAGLDRWRRLTSHISQAVLDEVLGPSGRVDGLLQVDGDEEGDDLARAVNGSERTMRFPTFKLKRSWREGAVGDEVTRYAKDKSWLMGHVATSSLGSDPSKLLAHLELAFILLLHLSSYSALFVYKRFLVLFCRSSAILTSSRDYLSTDDSATTVRQAYVAFLRTLSAQLTALPESAFDAELPEMDVFYLDEIASLRSNLAAAIPMWTESQRTEVRGGWEELQTGAKKAWSWDIGSLAERTEDEEGDEEEEGEYAPMVVET